MAKIKTVMRQKFQRQDPCIQIIKRRAGNTEVEPDTKAKTFKPIIETIVEKGAIMVTDEWGANNSLSHNEGEFVSNYLHTNSVEGFWSLLKRGIFGIYHSVSAKHLNKYCDEFSYHYNTRSITDGDRFGLSLVNADGKLTYKQLIQKNG